MSTKRRSNINKGRNFQKAVLQKFMECFELDENDCRTTIGCESGSDLKFNIDVRREIGLSIECKDTKALSIFAAIEQAKANTKSGTVEAVVFKKGDIGASKTYIAVPLEHYLRLRKKLRLNCTTCNE